MSENIKHVSDATFDKEVLQSVDARCWSTTGPNGAARAR